MRRIFFDVIILVVVVSTIAFVYQKYGEFIFVSLFGEQPSTMYVRSTPVSVTIADEPTEREQGLSGVESLGEFEGKLFVFSRAAKYGFWMRDMNFPLDIIWIGNDLKIVYIEENVSPDTYPDTFASPEPARFVLEVNAFFVKNNGVHVGDSITLPPSVMPTDLRPAS